jgi:hypothetical protein
MSEKRGLKSELVWRKRDDGFMDAFHVYLDYAFATLRDPRIILAENILIEVTCWDLGTRHEWLRSFWGLLG